MTLSEQPSVRPKPLLSNGDPAVGVRVQADPEQQKELMVVSEKSESEAESSLASPMSDGDAENSEPEDEDHGDATEPEPGVGDEAGEALEEAPIKRPTIPSDPTPSERERHNASHLPYRSWCPVCVHSRAREDPHYSETKEEMGTGLPRVSVDYATIGEKQDVVDTQRILVGRDKWTKHTFAHKVQCKGLGDSKIVKKLRRSIDRPGNTRVILKGDGEPALVQVQEAVKDARNHETILENPPAYDPQANGEAERAVGEIKAQLRAVKIGLESRLKKKVDSELPILEWMIPHSGDLITRYLIGADGKTPYYRIYQKFFQGKAYEFGEQVHAKPKRAMEDTKKKRSLASKWRDGTWVGFDDRTNEHLVVLASGPAVRVRTVRPKAESERWSSEAVEKIAATPDRPNPNDPSQEDAMPERLTKGLDFGDKDGADLPDATAQDRNVQKRDFRISADLLREHGYTLECPGCQAKRDNLEHRGHSAACRKRIEEAMKKKDQDAPALHRRDDRFFPPPPEAPLRQDRDEAPPQVQETGVHEQAQPVPEVAVSDGESRGDVYDNQSAEAVDESRGQLRRREVENEEPGEVEAPAPAPSKRQRLALAEMKAQLLDEHVDHVPRRERIESVLKRVIEQMVRDDTPLVAQLCNREILKSMVDDLDRECTKKVQRRAMKKASTASSGGGADVAEAYSPPRLTTTAERLGYRHSFALDLTTTNADGEKWDLSNRKMQEKALKLLDEEAPWLLMVSPPCTPFSALQAWNFPRQEQAVVEQKMKEGIQHMAFAVLLCLRQAKAGRKFVLEHPAGATSWQLALTNKLFFVKNGARVNFDFCTAGMSMRGLDGINMPVKKRTGIMTNSPGLVKELRQRQCPRDHQHLVLQGGKAHECRIYPEEFCELVCKAVMREKNKTSECSGLLERISAIDAEVTDITEEINALMPHPHKDEEEAVQMYQEFDFIDDVSGKPLQHALAIKARKLEMEFFRKMHVYEKVPRWHAREAGCKVITTRWLDVNKGDNEHPDYRARLVGRELKLDNRLDLFAATPPLESLRVICSICANNQRRPDPFRILSIDVKRAYFYAKAQRPMFIEIPVEDYEHGDEHRVGKLNLSLYGTRDAAQNWSQEYTNFLKSNGFIVGTATPCSFKHKQRQIYLTVHGDDFTITGSEKDLSWLRMLMTTRYEIKSEMLGPEAHMSQEIRVLNRIIRWTPSGVEYEPDQRHAEVLIQAMGMLGAKPVATPGVTESQTEVSTREKSRPLTGEEASSYRAMAARLNYLSLDRADLQFAAKEISKPMSAPRDGDWAKLKRVARYLVGVPRAIQRFQWQDAPAEMVCFTDSDWAGDKQSRKSTSGGVIMWGGHLLKSWSTTQQVIALSSAEAELYALLKGTAQTKGMLSMLADFGLYADCIVKTDASAALCIAHRVGLGRTRHIHTQYLWIQREVNAKQVRIDKVKTTDNPADVLTKYLSADVIWKHLDTMSVVLEDTRAKTAPRLQFLGDASEWKIFKPKRGSRMSFSQPARG